MALRLVLDYRCHSSSSDRLRLTPQPHEDPCPHLQGSGGSTATRTPVGRRSDSVTSFRPPHARGTAMRGGPVALHSGPQPPSSSPSETDPPCIRAVGRKRGWSPNLSKFATYCEAKHLKLAKTLKKATRALAVATGCRRH